MGVNRREQRPYKLPKQHRVQFQFCDKSPSLPKMMEPKKKISNQTDVGKKETLPLPQTVLIHPPEHVQTSPTTTDTLILVSAAALTFWIKGSLRAF